MFTFHISMRLPRWATRNSPRNSSIATPAFWNSRLIPFRRTCGRASCSLPGMPGLGEREESAQQLEMAVAMRPNDPSVLYNAACTYGVLDMKAEALGMLKPAIETGFTDVEWISRDTDLTCLHGEPEFKRIVEVGKPTR